MDLSLPTQSHAMRVGNLSGWALGFLKAPGPDSKAELLLTSNDYYARIEAALPGDLSGGRFQMALDGLTDAHYTALAGMSAVDLYLFWQDVNASILGYLGNIAGISSGPSADDLRPALIARVAISRIRRRAGERGYETVLEGRDWAFDRLSRRPAPLACYEDVAGALKALGDAAGITVSAEPGGASVLGTGTELGAEVTDSPKAGSSCLAMLRAIAGRVAEGLRTDAPSVVLLRDGQAHVGRRGMPFPAGTDPIVLDAPGGLAEVSAEGNAGMEKGPMHWRLLCRGRPDIKPGCIVRFKRPPEDVTKTTPGLGEALLGAFASLAGAGADDPNTTVYVSEVVHRQGRNTGFQSEITGLELSDPVPMDPWSAFLADKDPDSDVGGKAADSADLPTAVGSKVRDLARAALGRIRLPEVAEVRSVVAEAATPPEPPGQTVTLWEGTVAGNGDANAARRLAIRRSQPIERRGVATVTPFAWGQCGLIVPRYPGMRVAITYRNGKPEDPIEIGALWGDGARMKQTKPGDWWLCLPVDAPTAALGNSDTAAHEPSGQTTHDLIDAGGTRVIQTGKLTIRVGKPQLPKVGDRPAASAAAVSIEHADGKASISIDADGAISIKGTNIAIDAGSSGSVTINAKTVDVTVSEKMTVS
jgi:hypothetical protein